MNNVNKVMESYFKILCFIVVLFASHSISFCTDLKVSSFSNLVINDSCNLNLDSITPVTCFGANDGTITVSVDSGSGMYHYYLEIYNSTYPLNGGWQSVAQVPAPGQYTTISTVTFTALPSDTFRVILEDTANQCFDTIGFPTDSIFIIEPSEINIIETHQDATNILTSDGNITLNISGGIPSYNISWIGPNGFTSSLQNLLNIPVGIYWYTLVDNNGCIINDSIEITAIQSCSYGSFTSVPPICFGDANGQIYIDSVFGLPQFTYSLEMQDPVTLNWNIVGLITIVDTFYTFNNLFSGTYRYTLTDNGGCSIVSPQINVQDPTPISSNNTIINASSNLNCDGQISSIINGGVAPISHFWSGPSGFVSSLPVITNLCPGTYCDSVIDANGCNQILCDVIGIQPSCAPEVEITNVFCDNDSSGMAIVTKTENAYPLFTWTDIMGDTLSMDTFAINLPAGSYTFNAYSLGMTNACPDTSISFSILETEIDLIPFHGNIICTDDSTFFIVDPINIDSSFTYQIIIGNDIFSLSDSSMYYPAGNYTYLVDVDTGTGFIPCFSSQNVEVTNNNISIDSISVVDEICSSSKGNISIFASSFFLPLSYSIDTIYQSSPILSDLSSAYYSVNIMDNMSCLITQDSIFVGLSSLISLEIDSALETCLENDAWIEVIAIGGFGSYQYSIDSGITFSTTINSDTLIIDSLSLGSYYLIVRDDSLCVHDYGNIYINKTSRPKIDSVITVNESCCGNDGILSVYSTPSLSIVKYSIDTFLTYQTTNSFDSLFRGNYLIYIEDSNACLDSIEVYLEVDSTPYINFTVGSTDVVCNGDSNGTFKVYYPDSCYSYELYRYTFFTPQLIIDSGVYFNNLIPGFYGVIATSNSGTCIDSSAVRFIDEPLPITYDSPISTDVRCISQDSCNGTLFLANSPAGGISPYYYYVKDLSDNIPMGVLSVADTFQYLCPGEYEIQVVDANACVVYDTVFISDSSLSIDSFSVQSISCYNGDNGIVEVFFHGGFGDYSYLWSNADTTKIIDSLVRGEYFIEIIDSFGCVDFDSVFVPHPDTLQFKILEDGKKPETCMGVTRDGEIYLEITGGTPPYNYMWNSYSGFSGNSGSGFGDTIFNLTYDTITIDVTDANYCSASPTWGTVNVTIVDALNANNPLSFDSIYFPSSPICYGTHTGFIQIELNGGDMPIQYSIDSANTFSLLDSFPQLNAGKYNIYIMDTYGCLDSAIVSIEEYDELLIVYDSLQHISCYDGNDGYISVSNFGGVGPYSYFWIPTSETSNFISNLYALPHVVQVTDSAGCVLVDTVELYELTEPIQIQSEIMNQVSCFNGRNGALYTQPLGGMPPYMYWWIDENLDTVSTSSVADSLLAGVYICFVSDSFNCGPAVDTIAMTEHPEIEIDVIDIIDNICYGDENGELTFSVFGGNPSYIIYVLDQSNNILSTVTNNISSLASSDYSVWAIDDNLCSSDTLLNIKLGEPGRIKIINTVSNLTCFESEDGIMNISYLSGTSPYTFLIEDNFNIVHQGFVNQATNMILDNLSEGAYVISVTDFNGCFVDSVFVLTQPEEIIADFTSPFNFGRESFSFIAENTSVGGQVFYWDFDNDSTKTSSFLEEIKMQFLEQGEYHIMLVAHDTMLGHNCNDTIIYPINVEGYDVYNVFTPNNDGVNDIFHFNEWMINGIYVEIFNRWGDKIYHWEDLNVGWDGRGYNGRNAEEGVYFYRMEATGVDGTHFEENGSITLLR